MKNILTIILLLLSQVGYSQRPDDSTENDLLGSDGIPYQAKFDSVPLIDRQERKTLDTLVQLKVEYDRKVYIEKKKEVNLNSDESHKKYLIYIQRIKEEPVRSKLLTYIDQALQHDKNHFKKTYQYYSHIDKTLPFDRSKILSNYDYYKIVKYYLFEKNMDRLPQLKDVSIIEVNQWKIPAASDIRGHPDYRE